MTHFKNIATCVIPPTRYGIKLIECCGVYLDRRIKGRLVCRKCSRIWKPTKAKK